MTGRKNTNNKRKTKTSKLSKEQNLIYLGICLFLLSLFLFTFLVFKNTGIVGVFIESFLRGAFGFYGKIFPFVMLLISFVLLFRKLRENKWIYISHIIIISLLVMISLDTYYVTLDPFKEHLNNALSAANRFKGGGYIGAIFSHPIRQLLGDIGLYILVAFSFLSILFSILKVKKVDLIEGTETCVNKLEEKITSGYNSMKNKRIIMNPDVALKDAKRNDDLKSSDINSNKDDNIEFIDFKEDVDKTPDINTYNDNIDSLDTTENVDDVTQIDDFSKSDNYSKNKVEEKSDANISKEITDLEEKNEKEIVKKYVFPPIDLLKNSKKIKKINTNLLNEKAKTIEKTLASFGIEATVESINRGPTVTVYELKPAIGVKISRIVNLQDDLCLALESKDIRIVAPIPGKSRVGIETPNDEKDILSLKEMLVSDEFKNSKDNTSVALGKDIEGKNIITRISDMPHLLIAGATGSGKSVCINSIILSILYKSEPKDVKLLLIDPKVVELSVYNGIPHLLIPVVTDAKKASGALQWAVTEMEKRYALFAKNNVRDINGYNEKASMDQSMDKLKEIVIIIDELADLMLVSGKEVEESIARLAQMARAAGMYIIVATQRPSVDVITGTIKANIPSRISFSVSSQVDSRTILDMSGAEKLLGKGDMLFLHRSQSNPVRLQGPFVSDKEIEEVVKFIKENNGTHEYSETIQEEIKSSNSPQNNIDDFEDDLFEDAVLLVVKDNQGSISYLQRKLRIGYSRAARMIDKMEDMGIVGPNEGSKPRSVLVSLNELDEVLNKDGSENV